MLPLGYSWNISSSEDLSGNFLAMLSPFLSAGIVAAVSQYITSV